MGRASKVTQTERDEAKTILTRKRGYGVKPGTRVYAIVKHVSRSGMRRTIALLVAHEGRVHDISWAAAKVLGWRFDADRGGIIVNGAGMDMGFHAVYSLSSALFRDSDAHKASGREPGYLLHHERL